MIAQHTKERTAERGWRRPCRLRGSGTSARKERRPPRMDASMRRLHATLPRKQGFRYDRCFSYSPRFKLSRALGAIPLRLTIHEEVSSTLCPTHDPAGDALADEDWRKKC